MQHSNFHTHSRHCDGVPSIDELTREAISLGCPQLGFSSHAFMHFDNNCFGMSRESTDGYRSAVREAKTLYGDRIRLFYGVEQEYYCETPTEEYEYVIGSVHYVKKGNDYISVDHTVELQKKGIDVHYGGDAMGFVRDYYALVADVPRKIPCQILGHFDLITKFSERASLFDPESREYQDIALRALETISHYKVVPELNSGAVSRGYRTSCYPAPFLLDGLAQMHIPVVLSSDCHRKEALLFHFETMRELAKNHKLTVLSSMEEIFSYCNAQKAQLP